MSDTDITAENISDAGPDAVALPVNLMQRNSADAAHVTNQLVESLQRSLDEAYAEIRRMRRNVLITLKRPHTDAMIENALYVLYDYKWNGAP